MQVLIQIPFHSRSKKEEKKNPRSAWLRYHLLTMRLYQNFKKSTKVDLQKSVKEKIRQLSITQVDQIKAFVKAAKLGDW